MTTAIEAVGGSRPLEVEEFARRAHAYVTHPGRNPLKEVLDRHASVAETPPLLGIFNDIPWHQFRESEAHAWARAGFSWIVNDAEHRQREGWYGTEQNAAECRLGLLAIQRLHREALSSHGDAFQLGARGTMRPYGTTYEEAEVFYRSVQFPVPGQATAVDRGGYPVRTGDRTMCFTPDSLRGAETETQGWLQFETAEYIIDTVLRDRLLDLMAAQGRNKACGFVGPFDAILREGDLPEGRPSRTGGGQRLDGGRHRRAACSPMTPPRPGASISDGWWAAARWRTPGISRTTWCGRWRTAACLRHRRRPEGFLEPLQQIAVRLSRSIARLENDQTGGTSHLSSTDQGRPDPRGWCTKVLTLDVASAS